jgi:choline dehydrogenase-like flavoprotein
MLSGIGPKKHLKDVGVPCFLDVDGVGENLQDHLQANMDFHDLSKTVYNTGLSCILSGLYNYFTTGKGVLTTCGVEGLSFFSTDSYLKKCEEDASFTRVVSSSSGRKKSKDDSISTLPPPPNMQVKGSCVDICISILIILIFLVSSLDCYFGSRGHFQTQSVVGCW